MVLSQSFMNSRKETFLKIEILVFCDNNGYCDYRHSQERNYAKMKRKLEK